MMSKEFDMFTKHYKYLDSLLIQTQDRCKLYE